MAKIVAILGGGDWTDASVVHLVVPESLSNLHLEDALKEYNDWYFSKPDSEPYLSFEYWLKQKGWCEPNPDEFESIFQD